MYLNSHADWCLETLTLIVTTCDLNWTKKVFGISLQFVFQNFQSKNNHRNIHKHFQ